MKVDDQDQMKYNAVDTDVELIMESLAVDTLIQLKEFWQTFGLSDQEQLQQKKIMLQIVKKTCQEIVNKWRNEVEDATVRVTELERDVQAIKAQFQGNKSVEWCIQSLNNPSGGTLRDKIAGLEMEFKFLDSVRTSKLTEVNKLRDQLSALDKKLGTISVLPSGVSDLSEEYKVALQDLVKSKSREMHTRRAALKEAVSDCVKLAQELQVEAEHTFAADVNARLKKRDLSTKLFQKISQRIVELREVKVKREARLAEIKGQIYDLWQTLKISNEEQERFQMTIHGVGKAALASYEAELTRLQRRYKQFAALTVQVASLRNTIQAYWDILRIFRAHEKEVERLKRQASAMRLLTHYVSKREEILQAHAQHGVPDKHTLVQIEQDLPKYTAILVNRIAKWEEETGLVLRWNGKPYLEQMQTDDLKPGKQRSKTTKQTQSQQTVPTEQLRENLASSSDFPNRNRSVQQNNRHSINERTPPRLSSMEEQFHCRRSEPQVFDRPRWRKFIRSTFSRHDHT